MCKGFASWTGQTFQQCSKSTQHTWLWLFEEPAHPVRKWNWNIASVGPRCSLKHLAKGRELATHSQILYKYTVLSRHLFGCPYPSRLGGLKARHVR